MRIQYVSRYAWPGVGGIETGLKRLSSAMAERHEVRILTQRIDGGLARPVTDTMLRGARFEPLGGDGTVPPTEPLAVSLPRRLALAPLLLQASPRLRRGRSRHGRAETLMGGAYARIVGPEIARAVDGADLLHVLGGSDITLAAVHAAGLLNVPVVVTPSAHPGQWDDDAASAAAYRRADMVIGNLQADADVYRRLGVPNERVRVCAPIAERVPGQDQAAALRDRHDVTSDLVLFLGVRRAGKGFDLLLEAADRTATTAPDITYAFVGPGPALERRRSAARILDIGVVSEEEKGGWLAAADLLCLPSAAESYGLVVLEAFSTATPAVVSRIPTLTELIESAGAGEAVERTPEAFAEAIVRMLGDPQTLRRLGEAGAHYWHEHGRPEVVVEWHDSLYRELVAGRRG